MFFWKIYQNHQEVRDYKGHCIIFHVSANYILNKIESNALVV